MAASSFSFVSRTVVLCIIILFLWAYLFQNLLVAMVGAAVLLYLAYRRMEFHSLVDRLDLKFERKIMESIVHKGTPATILIEVSADEPVSIEVSEKIPDNFNLVSGQPMFSGKVGPNSNLDHSYSLLPLERGLHRLNPMEVIVKEKRGLFSTTREMGSFSDIFVRASKMEISLARLMSKRKQFEITGPAHQRHTRTHRAEFRSVREYMPGDRFRDMDWKAGARLTKLMTKEFEQETNLPTMLLMDASLSMKEMVNRRSKMDHAIALALQIAIVMDNHNHPVGLISFDENKVMEHLSPGKQEIDELLMKLFRLPNPVRTGGYPGVPVPEQQTISNGSDNEMMSKIGPFLVKGRRKTMTKERATGIFEAIRGADIQEETGLLMVLITDLETNLPSLMKAVKLALGRKHRLVVVSPFSWPYHLDKGTLTADELERAYMDRGRKQEVIRTLRGAGVNVIEIEPKERGETVLTGLRRMSQ